jgi:hypothetical protein
VQVVALPREAVAMMRERRGRLKRFMVVVDGFGSLPLFKMFEISSFFGPFSHGYRLSSPRIVVVCGGSAFQGK